MKVHKITCSKAPLLATAAACIAAAPMVLGQAKVEQMIPGAIQPAPKLAQSGARAIVTSAATSGGDVTALVSAETSTAAEAPTSTSTSPAAPPHFDQATIQSSPFANHPNTNFEYMTGSSRFYVRQATLLELIRSAWNAWTPDRNRILGGPSWLDFDRFDIAATAPHGSSQDDMRLMLRTLLTERFGLVVHTGTKLMPAYVLSVGKGGPKLKPASKPAEGTATDTGCDAVLMESSPPYKLAHCRSASMAEFAAALPIYGFAGGTNDYLSAAVVDQTGLAGAYDFEFKWTPRPQLIRLGSDGITLFDALDKQLGLKLEPKPAPLPVLYVDSVHEKPTPNAPGLDKVLAPRSVEVEVATFRLSAPGTRGPNYDYDPSSDQFILRGVTLRWLITNTWDIADDMLADAPPWLDKNRWDLVAKLAHDPANGSTNRVREMSDQEQTEMVKKLLAERFGLKVHTEDRPADAYTLVAANPHMAKADPDNRTGCHEGPGADGKDPRLANRALTRLMTCQNMTMAQFAEMLRINASGYIKSPVLDRTGLTGAYDFTIAFSGAGMLTRQPVDSSSEGASDPNPAVSLFDAVQKEMGVKLVKQKRPVQMLVIDHVNETPTEN